MSLPLVCCIMPTKNRREFVPKAIEYFLRQTYPNKELVIGEDSSEDSAYQSLNQSAATPDQVHYVWCESGLTLGHKRNTLVELAAGDLIAHWDDDDWYGPTRLADQVAAMQATKTDVCGLDSPLFYDLRTGQSYRYHFADGCPYGATLMYTRDFWARRPFGDIQVGETGPFMEGRHVRALDCANGDWFVGMLHDGNTCPKALRTKYFTPFPDLTLPLGADWPFYQGLRERMGVAA